MAVKTAAAPAKLTRKNSFGNDEQRMFHLMLLPGMVMLAIFVLAPLVGSVMAFEN
jgi:ABC-type polysaccharide transport system permease subunit